jgi:CheY-like chemotaxis protein
MMYHPKFLSRKHYLEDVSFKLLMQKRVYQILLICSTYDAYMLEEDGRIDEQIFDEYVSLNLRYPPRFIQASTQEAAFEVLEAESVDLVITMLSVGDPFELARTIKARYPRKPIVVLAPFSREVSLLVDAGNMPEIDMVFSWLGNAELLLAIIKLVEDKMNVQFDVDEIGVQTIMLVEDSVRFYSTYLPNLYKIIFKQSRDFMTEALNEHQQMLRMRGRPKVILAKTYEEAITYYEQYKYNLLGIITDMRYPCGGVLDLMAGKKLVEKVRNDDPYMPILIQSSNSDNLEIAMQLKVGFLNKNSKTLSLELREFINDQMAFGDFVFRNPETLEEIDRARDLQSLQHKIFEIPDNSLWYHINNNHFSKWLNARALFQLGEIFKYVHPRDFADIDEIKRYLFDTISDFRMVKGRGIIAEFNKESFDEYVFFARIGSGSLGGKARGLAFINSLLKRNRLLDRFENVLITIPRTVVLTTDVFTEFMEENNLYGIALSDKSDEEILNRFVCARLPFRIHENMAAFISVNKRPLAIRSSSLLEDSQYQPFAGIYSTYMVPKIADDRKMIEQLSNAIKCVYASVFFRDSKNYMTATSNMIDEEKMGIILQEVCGNTYGNRFYPAISGVARSINYYPIAPEKSEDGVVDIAYGLGKYIVDGGLTLRFSPSYPQKIIQLSSVDMALRETQKFFYALDLSENSFFPSVDDGINILKLPVKEAENDAGLRFAASTFDMQNNLIRDGMTFPGKRIITFANVLKYNKFPLAEILRTLLDVGQKEMNLPVEIEFAVNLDVPKGMPGIFNFLQIRPIVDNKETVNANLEDVRPDETIIYSTSALGNGIICGIHDLVYVKPATFNPLNNNDIANKIEKLNHEFHSAARNYVLVGPGRWGSSDPSLGIPVRWPQISAARVIVESGLSHYRIDPSQGTHFFHNLTSFRVGYFTVNPFINEGFFDAGYLEGLPKVYEDEHLCHIRFETALEIKIDGKKSIGVVFKPNEK